MTTHQASPSAPAAAAGTHRLGDRTVNRLGLGAMRLTGSAAFELGTVTDPRRPIAVLRRAVELGVNHIDTAAFYFSPHLSSNALIAEALRPYPEDLVIATKVGPGRDPATGEWRPDARPEELRAQVEENLRRLGRDHLDLVYFRRGRQDSVAEHVGALAELRAAGLIRQLGLSNIRPEHLAEAQRIVPVAAVQNRYSLDVDRPRTDDLLRICREAGIAFVPFFALAGDGREAGRTAPEHPAVQRIADAHGATAPQIRLAWTLRAGPHVLAIPGTGDPAHLEENIAAAAIRLTADDLDRLAEARPQSAG